MSLSSVRGSILFISHVYGEGGGQYLNVRNWALGFAARGYRVHVLYNTQDRNEKERMDGGLHLFPVQHKWSAPADISPLINFRMISAARHLVSSYEIDLVSFHSLYRLPASLAAWSCKLSGLPIVATSHVARTWGLDPIDLGAMTLGWINTRLADARTAIGPMAGAFMGDDVSIIWNSVDRVLFDPENRGTIEKAADFRKEFDLEGKTVILCPARITLSKGQMDLIKAAAELKIREKNITLVFAGREDAKYVLKLKKAAFEYGLSEDLIILGMRLQKEMPAIYQAADIIALPSHHAEGIPAVALEAFAMRKPFIGYDSGGTKDVVRNGENGLLIKEYDIPSLAEGLLNLMGNGPAGDRIIEAASRDIASDTFTLEGVLDRLEEVFLRFINFPKE